MKHNPQDQHAFVLSGGGARGYAHLGVLKAFAERGIAPSAISATSAGSIVAAFICSGFSTDEVREVFRKHKPSIAMQWRTWRSGFLSLSRVEEILRQALPCENFEDLKIPLYITATDFGSGGQAVFSSGPLVPAIIAASSIPVLFRPAEIQGVQYVDGGLSGNLPVEPLKGKYENITGVHVNPLAPYERPGGFLSNLERTLHLAIRHSVVRNRSYCNWFIEPEGLRQFGMFDFSKFDAIYEAGLAYTRRVLDEGEQGDDWPSAH